MISVYGMYKNHLKDGRVVLNRIKNPWPRSTQQPLTTTRLPNLQQKPWQKIASEEIESSKVR